jgi:hypothetical protein
MNQKDSNNVKSALDVIRRISADSDALAQLEILQQLVGASQGIIAAARKLSAPKAKLKVKKPSTPKIKPTKLTLPSERNRPPKEPAKEPAKEPVKTLPPPTSTTTQPIRPTASIDSLPNQQPGSEKP